MTSGNRLALAIGASVALHAGIATVSSYLPAGEGGGASHGATRLTARIESRPVPEPPQLGASAADARPEPAPREIASSPDPVAARPAAAETPSTPPEIANAQPQSGTPIGAAVYYVASELDQRPRPLADIEPEYPAIAPPSGGYTVLRILIDEDGAVDRVTVERSDPPGFFEDSAVAAFSQARFEPGLRGGRRVKSQMLVEVKFHGMTPVAPTSGSEARPAADASRP